MNSIQLVATRRLELRDMPTPPEPAPGEVLVRLRAVGICGSDMHWYKEGGIGTSLAVYPQVLGHEPAGEIAATGKGVDLSVGQRVIVEPAITCGHCEFCRSGHHNNCVNSIFMGSAQMPGLFREYAVMPQRNVVPIPDSLSFAAATILEPLAAILHILELTKVHLGDTVGVMGAGPVGLLTASVARMAGASRVFIADKVPHRLRLAREMGFDCAIEISKFQQAVMDETRGRGVDIVFDAAAALQTINMAVAIARLGGQVVLIGIPSEADLNIDIHTAMAKELNIQTVKRSNHNAHAAIELMESGRIGDRIVTHRLPLEVTPQAFEMLAEYGGDAGKVVIEIP